MQIISTLCFVFDHVGRSGREGNGVSVTVRKSAVRAYSNSLIASNLHMQVGGANNCTPCSQEDEAYVLDCGYCLVAIAQPRCGVVWPSDLVLR